MLVKYTGYGHAVTEYGHVREVSEGNLYATVDNVPSTPGLGIRLHDRVLLYKLYPGESSLGRQVTHGVIGTVDTLNKHTLCLPTSSGICGHCGDDQTWIIAIPSPDGSWQVMNRCDRCRTRGY